MAKAGSTSANGRRKRPRPTQKDIANALGLAQSTVATALNPEQRHRLQEATVERILACAKRLGYRSASFNAGQPVVRSRARISKPVIALVGSVVHDWSIFNELANAFNRYDIQLVPVKLEWFDRDEQHLWEYLAHYELSGVVLFNLVQLVEAETIRRSIPGDVPLVTVHCSLEDVISVKSNIEEIYMRVAMLHLIAGVKKLGLLLSSRDPGVMIAPGWTLQGRVRGFISALHMAGGTVLGDPEFVGLLQQPGIVPSQGRGFEKSDNPQGRIYYDVNTCGANSLHEHGYLTACRLIEEGALPDVVFCGSDALAVGFMCACHDRGVKVPEEVALWGCENTSWGHFAPVPLSSISHPVKMIAKEVTRTMMDLVGKRADPTVVYEKLLPGTAIVRESAGDIATLQNALANLPTHYARSFVFAGGSRINQPTEE